MLMMQTELLILLLTQRAIQCLILTVAILTILQLSAVAVQRTIIHIMQVVYYRLYHIMDLAITLHMMPLAIISPFQWAIANW